MIVNLGGPSPSSPPATPPAQPAPKPAVSLPTDTMPGPFGTTLPAPAPAPNIQIPERMAPTASPITGVTLNPDNPLSAAGIDLNAAAGLGPTINPQTIEEERRMLAQAARNAEASKQIRELDALRSEESHEAEQEITERIEALEKMVAGLEENVKRVEEEAKKLSFESVFAGVPQEMMIQAERDTVTAYRKELEALKEQRSTFVENEREVSELIKQADTLEAQGKTDEAAQLRAQAEEQSQKNLTDVGARSGDLKSDLEGVADTASAAGDRASELADLYQTLETTFHITRDVAVVAAAAVGTLITAGAAAPAITPILAQYGITGPAATAFITAVSTAGGTAAGGTVGGISNLGTAVTETGLGPKSFEDALKDAGERTVDDLVTSLQVSLSTAIGVVPAGNGLGASLPQGLGAGLSSETVGIVHDYVEVSGEFDAKLARGEVTEDMRAQYLSERGLNPEEIAIRLAISGLTSAFGYGFGAGLNPLASRMTTNVGRIGVDVLGSLGASGIELALNIATGAPLTQEELGTALVAAGFDGLAGRVGTNPNFRARIDGTTTAPAGTIPSGKVIDVANTTLSGRDLPPDLADFLKRQGGWLIPDAPSGIPEGAYVNMRGDEFTDLVTSSSPTQDTKYHDNGKVLFGIGNKDPIGGLQAAQSSNEVMVIVYDSQGKRAASFVLPDVSFDNLPHESGLYDHEILLGEKMVQLSREGWDLDSARLHVIAGRDDAKQVIVDSLSGMYPTSNIYPGTSSKQVLLDIGTGDFTFIPGLVDTSNAPTFMEGSFQKPPLELLQREISRQEIVEGAQSYWERVLGSDQSPEQLRNLMENSWGGCIEEMGYPVETLYYDSDSSSINKDLKTNLDKEKRLREFLDYFNKNNLPNMAGIEVILGGETYTVLDAPFLSDRDLAPEIKIIKTKDLKID